MPPVIAPLFMFVGFAMMAVMAVVHIAFALAVYRVAQTTRLTRTVWFVPPGLWALATLGGGMLVATAFWAIHYLTLRPPNPAQE